MTSSNNKSKTENVALGRIDLSERKSWLSIGFIWSGILICVPALMVGGMVGTSMTIGKAIFSMLLGYICILVFMIPLGISSADLGLPTVMNASGALASGDRESSFPLSLQYQW